MYDYLIVGSGLYGATFARLATGVGKKCLIIEKRDHIGGNIYTTKVHNIDIHVYGPHIFHCSDNKIWEFVNRFTQFNNYIHTPKAFKGNKLYSLPFNMNTFYEMWGCTTPTQAMNIIEKQRLKLNREPLNLEEQALCLVGKDIYETLIKDYTRKQWQKDPKDLPSFIIKRLPLRFTYNNNYFNDCYQGIPVDGYTLMVENMLDGIEVLTNIDYFVNTEYWNSLAKQIVFTGRIDQFYNYCFGELEYRTLNFEHRIINTPNYQGLAVLNDNSDNNSWTRTIEHKHFTGVKSDFTVITKETPVKWNPDSEPYYPINDTTNQQRFNKYKMKAKNETNIIFGGRLAEYRYYDMHQVIGSAMKRVKQLC